MHFLLKRHLTTKFQWTDVSIKIVLISPQCDFWSPSQTAMRSVHSIYLVNEVTINIMMTSSNGNIFCVTGLLTRSFIDFKRLSIKSRDRWFETPSLSLWRHCNVAMIWEYMLLFCCKHSSGVGTFKIWIKQFFCVYWIFVLMATILYKTYTCKRTTSQNWKV